MDGYLGHAMTVAEFDKKLAASDFAREITEIILHHSATRDCDSLPVLDRMMDAWEYYWRTDPKHLWTEGVFGLVSQCGFGQFMALGAPNRGAGFTSKTRLNLEVLGTFTTIPPTGVQWANTVQVCAAIKKHSRHDVTITTHRAYNTSTQCPGDAFLAKVPQLITEVNAMTDDITAFLNDPATVEEARRKAYESIGVSYNKDAALTKAARGPHVVGTNCWLCDCYLGRALASEFRHAIGNRIVFVQAYENGFVFCAQDHYGPEEMRYAEW